MTTKASVLDEPSISGTVPEYWFDAAGRCSWFRFEDNSGDAWAGVFGRGNANCNAAIPFSDGKNFFIIAGGQGYIIESFTHKLRHKTSIDYFTNAIAAPNKELVIACDFTKLYAFDTQNLLWRSDRVTLDGIKLDSSTEDELFGKVWQPDGWYAFTLQYKDLKVVLGSCLSTDWFKYSK